jgi:hypothetical protein
MDERIEMAEGRLKMVSNGRTLDLALAAEFEKLVWTFPADALFHGEESFYVAFLPDRVWVLPYFTAGIRALLEAVGPSLGARAALFRAEVAGCPLRWRRRVIGLLPLFPIPALGSYPLRTAPDFLGIQSTSMVDLEQGATTNG